MARATLKDVAQEAGVSSATVSYILNGKRSISEETKARVMEAIKKLDYVPDLNARGLTMRDSKLIGVVVPQTEPGVRHDNAARIHADLAQRPGEHRAEGVRAHLAQKRRPAAEPRDGREEIGGRTAGMRRHERIAVRSRPLRRKVNEQLAKRNDVILRPRHPLPSPRSHSKCSASR